jgi:undecaprenyl diphosphate synthase
MTTHSLPDLDLLIRTGGENRVSDFLLFEAAYAEFVFLPIMWPEFTGAALREALGIYAQRERRFGMTTDQVRQNLGRTFDPLDSSGA